MATATAKKRRSHDATAARSAERPSAPERETPRPTPSARRAELDPHGVDALLTDALGFDGQRLQLLARREQLRRGGEQRVAQTIRDLLRRLLLDLANQLDVRPLSAPDPAALALPVDEGDVSPARRDADAQRRFEDGRRRDQVRSAAARGETTAQRNGEGLSAAELARATAARSATEEFDNQLRARQTQREIERRL